MAGMAATRRNRLAFYLGLHSTKPIVHRHLPPREKGNNVFCRKEEGCGRGCKLGPVSGGDATLALPPKAAGGPSGLGAWRSSFAPAAGVGCRNPSGHTPGSTTSLPALQKDPFPTQGERQARSTKGLAAAPSEATRRDRRHRREHRGLLPGPEGETRPMFRQSADKRQRPAERRAGPTEAAVCMNSWKEDAQFPQGYGLQRRGGPMAVSQEGNSQPLVPLASLRVTR